MPLTCKIIIAAILCAGCSLYSKNIQAQLIDKVAHQSIDQAVTTLTPLLLNRIPPHVKILGVGDVCSMAKESVKFNTALMAYLIKKKEFCHIHVLQSDWKLRPLNDYLLSQDPFDSTHLRKMINNVMGLGNYMSIEFAVFLEWLKKSNLSDPKHKASLSGVGVYDPIPASYFLNHYIFPLDEASGKELSGRWAEEDYSDTLAFKEVLEWYNNFLRNKIQKDNSSLVKMLDGDIAYNIAVEKKASALLSADKQNIERSFQVSQFRNNFNKKAIFYAGNWHVARTFMQIEELNTKSIGMTLNDTLKKQYFVSVTGFSGKAQLNLLDIKLLQFRNVEFAAKARFSVRGKASDYFFASQHPNPILNAAPDYISAIIGDNQEMVPGKKEAPQDAVFLLKDLTPMTTEGGVIQFW